MASAPSPSRSRHRGESVSRLPVPGDRKLLTGHVTPFSLAAGLGWAGVVST